MQMVGMLRHGTCIGARRRMNSLCDGELPAPAATRVRRHVAGCRRCRRVLTGLERVIADVDRLEGDVPDSLLDGIRRAVEHERSDGSRSEATPEEPDHDR
ncbi:MAG: zf-HC2 domain-containing protein [Acidimicrobiales bacterium]